MLILTVSLNNFRVSLLTSVIEKVTGKSIKTKKKIKETNRKNKEKVSRKPKKRREKVVVF